MVAVGTQATELVNAGVVAIEAESTIETVGDSIAAHPTLARPSRRPRWWRSGARSTCRRPRSAPRPRPSGRPCAPAGCSSRRCGMRRPTPSRSRTSCSSGPASSRQVGAGLWTCLPLGLRSLRRVMQIIREEMDAIGGQEMLLPVLHPAEIWRRSGRYDIDAALQAAGPRPGATWCSRSRTRRSSPSTPRREMRSYRDLPQIWYHIQTKERDEPRPQGGVLRTREFIMKDSYTLDRDRGGPGRGLRQARDRPTTRIFDALRAWSGYKVESDIGMMGGSGAHEYMAPSPAGEDRVALARGRCDYAANVEMAVSRRARARVPARGAGRGGRDAGRGHDRGARASTSASTRARRSRRSWWCRRTTAAASCWRSCAATTACTTSSWRRRCGDAVPAGDARGDRGRVRRRARARSAPVGVREGACARSWPTRCCARARTSPAPTAPAGTCATSTPAATTRRAWPTSARRGGRRLRRRRRAARCASSRRSRSATSSSSARSYSEKFGATYLDEDGAEQPIWMGSYGIGPARTLAAVVEQPTTSTACIWPRGGRAVRRVDHGDRRRGARGGRRARRQLAARGLQALVDDRALSSSPPEKVASPRSKSSSRKPSPLATAPVWSRQA